MISVYTKNIDGVWFGVACADQSVFGTAFANSQQETIKKLLRRLPLNVPFQVFPQPSAFAEPALAAAKNVYDGNNTPKNTSLALATEHLSAYTRKVLETASAIPAGYVASYGAVAKAAGGSPRAAGHVMASNPFAPIVPCHRVVSADFTLGGYGGGLKTKLEFLTREKRGYVSPREIRVGNKKLHVFPVEYVLKKLGKD